ncbi:precorrin-4 C(11)-methyltransferase [Lacrimispora sp. JR3]|uniref:precorrin-4 C(11)-methyltransferase n=1 Tax=Lacrimispora sinapis TaxID=3111456 RepID=UPI00374984CD
MVHMVGAGPGAPDLITMRGKELLSKADVIIYAGSLVNPQLLDYKKEECLVYDSARMTLEEVISVIEKAESEQKMTVRLHTGDPSLYGAIREQMDQLEARGISYEVCPGVSSLSGAASALKMEYTLPDVSQSVVITRMAGRTPVPEKESIASFASHGATMVIFLSTGMLKALSEELVKGGYLPETPAAIVYKATWEEEKTVICTVGTLKESAEKNNIKKTALIIVGNAVSQNAYQRSKLYDPDFTTEYRKGTGEPS